jgi:hypothetical protein
MAGPIGRLVRVVVGLALLAWGWTLASTIGWVVMVVGAVAFLSGALNLCLIAPLFGAPFLGKDVK